MYNWNAVNTGKLCPAGWHVPSDNEWKQMDEFKYNGNEIQNIWQNRLADQRDRLRNVGNGRMDRFG
ncbi:MAG TPA: hypothetical protein DDW27_09035 [Bacteroidales bacterium]|nr:hypothetical protein [Bacteroidales bacterium]